MARREEEDFTCAGALDGQTSIIFYVELDSTSQVEGDRHGRMEGHLLHLLGDRFRYIPVGKSRRCAAEFAAEDRACSAFACRLEKYLVH